MDKPVEELRKIKLTSKEKEIYYKGFDNCERQFATHIAELQQQLKSQPREIIEKIKETAILDVEEYSIEPNLYKITAEDLDNILKEYQIGGI